MEAGNEAIWLTNAPHGFGSPQLSNGASEACGGAKCTVLQVSPSHHCFHSGLGMLGHRACDWHREVSASELGKAAWSRYLNATRIRLALGAIMPHDMTGWLWLLVGECQWLLLLPQ